jgi:DNA-binding MarR family transcriptional regulator
MGTLRDPRQHDELLNYQLNRLVRIGGAPAIRLCEGRYGISRFQWRLTAALVEDGPMSPGALSLRVRVDPGRVSLALSALIEKGLASRARQAGDKRRALVTATSAGHALYAELFPQLAAINRRLTAVLTEDEAERLAEYLRRLTLHAMQIYDAGGGVDARTERRLGRSGRSAFGAHRSA